jgi:nitroreductase
VNVSEAISQRRSIRRFDEQPPSREDLEAIMRAATTAPNHKLTQPWRFYVLGPDARAAYGRALGVRKAKKAPDEAAGAVIRERTADEHRAIPCMIAVAMTLSDNPETLEEDYAAVMMSVALLSLAAVERGLGTHIKTGGVMQDAAARSAVGVPDTQKIVAIVNVGRPAELPPARERAALETLVNWVE